MHVAIHADPIDNQKAGVHMFTKHLISNLLKIDKKNKYTLIHREENPFFNNTNHIILKPNSFKGKEVIRKFIKLPYLSNKLNPDIVFEPSYIGPFFIKKGIKKAVLIHDLTPILTPEFHIDKSVRTYKILLPYILNNADLIITPSETTKSDIKKYSKTKALIKVVNPGVYQKENIVKEKPKTPYILSIGTIEPRKNIPTLIDSFLELKKEKNIPHKLILVGKIGWKTDEIIKKAKSNKDIILKGYLSEQKKEKLLMNAEIFVYPSFYEGFGMPPMEAMSYGIPTITSNGGSLKEIYENEALTHDPLDKTTLKNHILKLIENPELREKISLSHIKFSQKFSWEKSANDLIDAFQEILKTK